MEVLIVAVVALLTIALLRTVAPRLRVAAPLLLVLLGFAVALVPQVPDITVSPELVLEGVLPPLLYAAAVSTPAMDFRRDLRVIGGMSILLVAVTAVAIGFLVHAIMPDLPLAAAIALGAIVSPTDAVATSIVRDVGVSPRITAILEGESLLNDATALALLRSAIAVTIVTTSTPVEVGDVVWDFVRSLAIAVAIGYAVARLNLLVRRRISQPVVNTVISFTVPFIASVPATLLDASGLVAAVVAGLVTGHAAPRYLSPSHRASEELTWRTVEFVLEGGVFLLMGLELTTVLHGVGVSSHLGIGLVVAAVCFGVVLVVRLAYVTYLLWGLNRRIARQVRIHATLDSLEERLDDLAAARARDDDDDAAPLAQAGAGEGEGGSLDADAEAVSAGRRGRRRAAGLRRLDVQRQRRRIARKRNDLAYYEATPLGWREGGVLTWAGMRGVVTVVAAQTIPHEVPMRSVLVFIAFVVATISLLLQGGTLSVVVRWLRPARIDRAEQRAEHDSLEQDLHTAAWAALFAEGREGLETLRADLESRHGHADLVQGVSSPAVRRLRLRAIDAQREELLRLRDDGAYSSDALNHALAVLDAQQIALEVRAAAEAEDEHEDDASGTGGDAVGGEATSGR